MPLIVAGVAAFGLAVSILVRRGGSSAAEKNAVDIADNVLPSLTNPSDRDESAVTDPSPPPPHPPSRHRWRPKALAIVAGVAAFGLAVSILVGGGGSSAAEKSAVDIADNVLPSLMDPSDLAAPVIGSRYDQLASDIQKTVTDPNILRVTVWQRSGVVVFSTNPDLVGLAVSGAKPMVDSAFSGKVQSSVGIGDAMPTDSSQQGETYRTFAPIRLQPGDPVTGVAEVVQPVPEGSGSGLWSAAKLVFSVVLIVSLVWLWVVMVTRRSSVT